MLSESTFVLTKGYSPLWIGEKRTATMDRAGAPVMYANDLPTFFLKPVTYTGERAVGIQCCNLGEFW